MSKIKKVIDSWPEPFDGEPTSNVTNLADAKRFHEKYGRNWAYFDGLGWHEWKEDRWVKNESGVFRVAAKIGRVVLSEAQSIEDSIEAKGLNLRAASELPDLKDLASSVNKLRKHAAYCESKRSVDNTLSTAKNYLMAEANQISPYALPCKNGLVCLTTGSISPHKREDFNIECLSLSYDVNAVAPRWESFIAETFSNDKSLIEYVHRLLGYCISGSVEEHVAIIGYGAGRNGKSTLIEVLNYVLDAFSKSAPSGLLTNTGRDNHPTEIAFLQGARFISVSETGRGKSLNEERLKWMTGGDTLTARLMHGNNFNFTPTHKFFIVTNHKPKIEGHDEGIWRRIHLLPFNNNVDKDKLDTELMTKLRNEAEGILSWLIRGAIKWRSNGLQAPDKVKSATQKYRSEMDVVEGFLAECFEKNSTAKVGLTELREAYTSWSIENEQQQMTARRLNSSLESKGFCRSKSGSFRYWKGLKFKY